MVDSFDELDRLDRLVPELGVAPPACSCGSRRASRRTPTSTSRTGQDDSKFGFTLSTGLAAQAVDRATASPHVELVGIHVHIGSQVFVADFFRAAWRRSRAFFNPLGLDELSIGGGIGVAYVEDEEAPTITDWAEAVHTAARAGGRHREDHRGAGPVHRGAAGVTVYTVGTIKELPGLRTYVAVDGGMSDNPRPVIYESGYEAFLAREVDAPTARGR